VQLRNLKKEKKMEVMVNADMFKQSSQIHSKEGDWEQAYKHADKEELFINHGLDKKMLATHNSKALQELV